MWKDFKQWWWNDVSKQQQCELKVSYNDRTVNQIYWFECIGMFIFVFLQACTKQPTGIHLQITLVLLMAIPMCAKISGAHYNPAVTVSNFLCRYKKFHFSYDMMWLYFKAQLYSATFALALGYIINNGFLAKLALPNDDVSAFQIFLSQFLATAFLVFYTQLAANDQTSFAQHDVQKYCFIIAFVFYARRSAHVSAFAINPAITIATVIMDVFTCSFVYFRICYLYLLGDFLGAIFGTLVYNKFYSQQIKFMRQKYQLSLKDDLQMQRLIGLRKIDSNLRQQSTSFAINYQQIVRKQSSQLRK